MRGRCCPDGTNALEARRVDRRSARSDSAGLDVDRRNLEPAAMGSSERLLRRTSSSAARWHVRYGPADPRDRVVCSGRSTLHVLRSGPGPPSSPVRDIHPITRRAARSSLDVQCLDRADGRNDAPRVAACAQRVLLGDVSEPTVDVSRIESVGVALTMFSIVGASSLLYASSRTWIYHEAILWGSALTMAAIAVLLVWMDTDDINSRQSHRLLVLTSSLTMLALLTRPSVAGGALAALGLVMAKPMVDFVIRGRRGGAGSTVSTPAIEPRLTGLTFVLMSAALSAPIVSYSIVNWLKFPAATRRALRPTGLHAPH